MIGHVFQCRQIVDRKKSTVWDIVWRVFLLLKSFLCH